MTSLTSSSDGDAYVWTSVIVQMNSLSHLANSTPHLESSIRPTVSLRNWTLLSGASSLETPLANHSNSSTVEARGPTEVLAFGVLALLLISLCLVTFVGNAMVLHAVRMESRLQTVSEDGAGVSVVGPILLDPVHTRSNEASLGRLTR